MNTTTIAATYSDQQVWLSFEIDLEMRTRLVLSATPVELRASHAAKVARLAEADPSLTDVTVA